MHKHFLVLLILSLFPKAVFSEVVHTEVYNYYCRNIDGTFILDNLDEEDLPVSLFRYVATFNDGQLKTIAGLYYGTEEIKFLDTIEISQSGNRIYKTEYFSYNPHSLPIIIWQYHYNSMLYQIDINVTDIIISRSFFELNPEDNTINYQGLYIKESRAPLYIYSEGVFSSEYRPLKIESSIIRIGQNNTLTYFNTSEEYHYYNSGILSHYSSFRKTAEIYELLYEKIISEDNSIVEKIYPSIQNLSYNQSLIKREEINNQMRTLYTYSTGIEIKEPDYVSRIHDIAVSLNIEYPYDRDQENGSFILHGDDESIYFDSNRQVIKRIPNLPVDFLSENEHRVQRYNNLNEIRR
jgi:hypothetical protein